MIDLKLSSMKIILYMKKMKNEYHKIPKIQINMKKEKNKKTILSGVLLWPRLPEKELEGAQANL